MTAITTLIRRSHPWFGIALVALTLVNVAAFAFGQAIEWLYYLPLIPLFLVMLSGTWMFVARHGAKPRTESPRA